MTQEFDQAVLKCFVKKQSQLFPENVVQSREEAEEFLEECMAVVVNSIQEVLAYFEEVGIDTEGAGEEEILEAAEVFDCRRVKNIQRMMNPYEICLH